MSVIIPLQLENASADVEALASVVNNAPDSEDVLTRLGQVIKPLSKVINQIEITNAIDSINLYTNNAITEIDNAVLTASSSSIMTSESIFKQLFKEYSLYDFRENNYYHDNLRKNISDIVSTTRASKLFLLANPSLLLGDPWQAYDTTEFDVDVSARINEQGIIANEEVINYCRNPRMEGGTTGAFPTYMNGFNSVTGCVRTLIAETIDGVDYHGVKYTGTPSANTTVTYRFELSNGIAAVAGENWLAALNAVVPAGCSLVGVNAPYMQLRPRDASTYLTTPSGTGYNDLANATTTPARYQVSGVMPINTENVIVEVQMILPGGVALPAGGVGLLFGAPTICKAAVDPGPIFPPVSTPGVSTLNASDHVIILDNTDASIEGITVLIDWNVTHTTVGNDRVLFCWGTDADNCLSARISGSSQLLTSKIRLGGVDVLSFTGPSPPSGRRQVAFKFKNGDFSIHLAGYNVVKNSSSVTWPTLTTAHLGSLFGTLYCGEIISRIDVVPALEDAVAKARIDGRPSAVSTIYVYGDSFPYGTGTTVPATDSYPAKLQELYGSRAKVINMGVAGETSSEILARLVSGPAAREIIVFNGGRNNPTETAQIISDAEAVLDFSVSGRVLIMGITNGPDADEKLGGANYHYFVDANDDLEAALPDNFALVGGQDIREYWIDQYNPALGGDVTDHTDDVPPRSQRAAVGDLHMNNDGAEFTFAPFVKSNIDERNWIP